MLRETIARRGSLRPVLVLIGIGLWALALTAVLAWLPYPAGIAIPLVVLLTAFEAIRPLHFGAERIGRYVQVFYEEAGDADRPFTDTPSWERVAMNLGAVPGVGGHPLFVPTFSLATVLNYLGVFAMGPVPVELVVMAIPHLAFLSWLGLAHRAMKTQRATELARFRALTRIDKR